MSFRLRGFFLHLSVSMILALLSIILVFVIWYPSPLYLAVGVTTIFLILLGVDVILGPLLTLLVCKEGKKSLKFDLAVIVFLQLSAFAYGMYTVAQGRPVWIVFNIDRFDLVQAYQVANSYRSDAKPEYRKFSLLGPRIVAARRPLDVEAQNTLIFESLEGIDIPVRPDLYLPYADDFENVKAAALPLASLSKYNRPDDVNKILAEWPDADAFLPMMTKVRPMTVLIKKETGSILAIVPLIPWG